MAPCTKSEVAHSGTYFMLTAVTAELNRFAQNHQSQLLLVFAIRVFDISTFSTCQSFTMPDYALVNLVMRVYQYEESRECLHRKPFLGRLNNYQSYINIPSISHHPTVSPPLDSLLIT